MGGWDFVALVVFYMTVVMTLAMGGWLWWVWYDNHS